MKLLCFLVVASIFLAIGCSQDTAKSSNSGSSSPPASVDSHAHASEGLHHGTLIELGNEKYHAELVHDEQSVTIYILDRAATKAIPIDAAEVTINFVHDGKPAQYKLPASPDANDPAGQSSRYTLQDAQLIEELEHHHAAAKLSLLIDGKAYRGEIGQVHKEHSHAH